MLHDNQFHLVLPSMRKFVIVFVIAVVFLLIVMLAAVEMLTM